MSYCRFIEGDVYVYRSDDGIRCQHWDENGLVTHDAEEMVRHLEQHIANGDHVPSDVIPEIRADAAGTGWRALREAERAGGAA